MIYSVFFYSLILGGGVLCSYRGRGCDYEVWCGWGFRVFGYMVEGWIDFIDRR